MSAIKVELKAELSYKGKDFVFDILVWNNMYMPCLLIIDNNFTKELSNLDWYNSVEEALIATKAWVIKFVGSKKE